MLHTFVIFRNELLENEEYDINVKGFLDEGKYIIRRRKLTGNDQSDQNGFHIAFRKDNDKDWTFSEKKHTFGTDNNGDDKENDLDPLITTTRFINSIFLF